jgi:predicted anti-sigma-YlaC factor YlaD
VTCDRYREAVSARLDGEPLGMAAAALDAHLSACPACARWAERAAAVTRQLRVGAATVPDLSAAITESVALPARRVLRRRALLRAALVLIGIVQLALAIPALAGDSIGMTMAVHAAHEAAAWNLALAAGFVVAAIVPRRAAGLVPLLAVFLVVLTVLSVGDLLDGAVAAGRVLTHLAALAGLALLIAVDRAERALVPPGPTPATRDEPAERNLRGVA